MDGEGERDEISAAVRDYQSMATAIATLRGLSISRSFEGAAFTIGLGDDDEQHRSDALVREARLVDSDVHAEPTGIGWGGDSGAVALVLDAVERFGAVGGGVVLTWSSVKFTCRRVMRFWRHFRDKGITPDMSVGAVGYLCLADLHDAVGDRFDGINLVHAGELMPEAGAALGHSGAGELYFYLFADGESS